MDHLPPPAVRAHMGWLTIDAQGWQASRALSPAERRWTRKPGDLMTLRLESASDPPFPLTELPRLRQYYREILRLRDAALVSLDTWRHEDLYGLVIVAKYPDQDAYSAEIRLPYDAFTFVIGHWAQPYGVPGDRECVALLAAQQRGEVDATQSGFYRDLYDERLRDGPLVRSLADDEEWDAHFPEHPLSRLRGWLAVLPSRVRSHRSLAMASPFSGQPDSARCFLRRARAWRLLAETDKAVADCGRALQLDSQRDDGYFLRARLHLEQGAWPEAEEDLVRAISRRPGVAAYHFYLSLALHRSGREREAAVRYTEAMRLEPRCGR